jgi:phage FluMu protein Com
MMDDYHLVRTSDATLLVQYAMCGKCNKKMIRDADRSNGHYWTVKCPGCSTVVRLMAPMARGFGAKKMEAYEKRTGLRTVSLDDASKKDED